MRISALLMMVALLASSPLHANDPRNLSLEELRARFPELVAQVPRIVQTEYGRKYLDEFISDTKFLRECAPSASQVVKPATLYVTVKEDGSVGQLEIYPHTETAGCLEQLTKKHVFPKPPFQAVMEIDVNFSPVVGDFIRTYMSNVPRIPIEGHPTCEHLSMGPSFNIESPTSPGGTEFSMYNVYACNKAEPRSFVVWRTRHFKGEDQLVGELILSERVRKDIYDIDQKTGQRFPSFGFTRCAPRGYDKRNIEKYQIDALYTGVQNSRPFMKRIFSAWRIDFKNMALVPVSISELGDCIQEVEFPD